jgi:DNA-binding NarL/FixJ family response regulator
MKTMKILICDDHPIVRNGLKLILQQLEEEAVIMDAGNGNEALSLLSMEAFDIVILDISLPDKNGLDVLQLIKASWPLTRVLILSMHQEEQYAMRAFSLGAWGYLTKDTAAEELVIAIKKIGEGAKYLSKSLAAVLALHVVDEKAVQKEELLSQREMEIMIKLAGGKSLKEISDDLFISYKTVSTYRSRLMDKMGFKKNTDLTRYCLEKGLI